MNALEETFRQTMPNEMGYDYLGLSFQEKKAQQGVSPTVVFGMSLIFVFLILAALYESWSLPFSVLLGTPVAVFGAFATLWLRGMQNNIYAQIGLIMLIGLAAKTTPRRYPRRRAPPSSPNLDDFLCFHLRASPALVCQRFRRRRPAHPRLYCDWRNDRRLSDRHFPYPGNLLRDRAVLRRAQGKSGAAS